MMIDLLIDAARFDFSKIQKMNKSKIRNSLLLTIIIGIISICIVLTSQIIRTDTLSALDIIQNIEYQIDGNGLSLNEEELIKLNKELIDTGYSIDKDAVMLQKNRLITFNQLLLLTSQSKLTSRNIRNKVEMNKDSYSNFVYYYFYCKEGLIIIWLIILTIILTRVTQKYLKQNKNFSFQQVYTWVTILLINPILIYTVMSLLDVRLSYRIFVFTVSYILVTFIFSRYILNNIVVDGEKNKSIIH